MDGTSNQFSGDNRGQMFQAGRIDRVEYNAAPSTYKALAGLPPTTSLFRGRASELEVLRSAWETGGGPSIVASGLAGIGKTEVVLHAAHQAVRDGLFPGGVLFVDLQGYDDQRRVGPEKVLETFLLALGVRGAEIPAEVDQRSTLFRSLLTKQDTMLIVLDNARSAEQVRPLLPGTPQHRVVITSRHKLTSVDGAEHIEVGLLSEAEAVQLVGDAELARLCGRLPLALRIMKALIATDPHADWAAELSEARLELLDDGDNRAVHAAFALSYRSLTSEQQRLFRLLALHPGDEVVLEAAAPLIGLSAARARVLLRELRRAHLLEDGTKPGRFQFHDLVRLYADRCLRDESVDERDAALDRVLAHYTRLASTADDHLAFHPASDSTFATRADALAWFDQHRPTLVAAVVVAADHHKHRATIDLAVAITEFTDTRCALNDGIIVSTLRLWAARQSGDVVNEMRALNHLGCCHLELGDFDEALRLLNESANIGRTTGDRFNEGAALHSLGKLHHDRQDLDMALTCLTESLVIDRELKDKRSEWMTLDALAQTYESMGRHDDARARAEEALAISVALRDPRAEGWARYRLGVIQSSLDELDEALATLEKSVDLQHGVGDHFGEACAQMFLGDILRRLHNLVAARTAFHHALRLFEQLGLHRDVETARDALTWLDDPRET